MSVLRQISNFGRRHELIWRYGFNFKPSLGYQFYSENNLTAATRKIVNRLNRDGIAVASVDDFSDLSTLFINLDSEVEKLLTERRAELAELKRRAIDIKTVGEKTFNVELLGSPSEFAPESVFARFALQNSLLDVANAYLKMYAKLRYYNVWKTFATPDKPRESQLWHYDREDRYILKVFVYLKDVEDGAGPFTYAPKTHRKGSLHGREPEFFMENGVRRTTDQQMAAIVPKENWLKATGKKGTIVFADTRGFHKGGEAKTDDRLMFTAMFTSPASESKRLLTFPKNLPLKLLNEKQLAALEIS
jgi:hypothetical protein